VRDARLSNLRRFSPSKALPELVYGSAGARVFLLCLEPGQGLPARRDSEEAVCYVVEGSVTLRRGEEELSLSVGDLAGVAPGELRSVTAEERSVVLWMQIAERRGDEAKSEEAERPSASSSARVFPSSDEDP
jgi:quercetin dioxygenase-like cupin family protein